MTIQELVQRVHQLAETYNQTHDGTLAINYHKGQYRLIHSKVPTFNYYIHYFNTLDDDDVIETHIQEIFETVKELIAIHKALNEKLQSNRMYCYENRIELYDDDHETILMPLSEDKVAIEQTYRPSLTEINFIKNGVEILLESDSPYHWINAFYTAKAEVPLDELNDTIEALREKTKNVL